MDLQGVLRVAVLGGGIKGCALAALLAQAGLSVTVYEASPLVGSDTTAHNHGRLHLGTAGWFSELDRLNLVRRRIAGSAATRRLVEHTAETQPACYWFTDSSADDFAAFLGVHGLPVREVSLRDTDRQWLNVEPIVAYEVDEYGFDPARLAGRLAATAIKTGKIVLGAEVTRVSLGTDGATVVTAESSDPYDVVVNAGGRKSASIIVEDREPLLSIEQKTWRVMCGKVSAGHVLDRVYVMANASGAVPSLIGHGPVATFDCKDQPVASSSDSYVGLRKVDDDAVGRLILSRIETYYNLAGLDRDSIRVFTGTQGRIAEAAPGSVGSLNAYPDNRHYFHAFGGQASTAVLDALDIVMLLKREGYVDADAEDLLDRLASAIEQEPIAETSAMVWRSVS